MEDCLTSHHRLGKAKSLKDWEDEGDKEILVFIAPPLVNHSFYCRLYTHLGDIYDLVGVNLPKSENARFAAQNIIARITQKIRRPFHLIISSATGWLLLPEIQDLAHNLRTVIAINIFTSNTAYRKQYNRIWRGTKVIPQKKFISEVVKQINDLVKDGKYNQDISKPATAALEKLGKKNIRQQISWFLEKRNKNTSVLRSPVLSIKSENDPLLKEAGLSSSSYISEKIVGSRSLLIFLTHPEEIAGFISEWLDNLNNFS